MAPVGEVYAWVEVTSNGHSLKKRLLVDTGATFSWISQASLRKLGVKPTDTEQFETIEGRVARRKLGVVEIELLGRRAPTMVVFAQRADSEVLGLHALEGLRLEVDPVNRKLKRCKAVKSLLTSSIP
jgi:predicted aspartyl protease